MSKTLDPMDLKQIITLHLDGLSNRKIGETLGISRNTINRYLQLFKGSEYSLTELLKSDQQALSEQFSVKTTIDNEWFDDLSVDELRVVASDQKRYDYIADRIKNGGGKHEWLMVGY